MLVVEEMTLLSNLFRSIETKSEDVALKKIGIRNLTPVEENINRKLSIEAVISERDVLLEAAGKKIEEEQQSIAEMREKASKDIAALQSEWENEKVVLQQQAYEEGFQTGFGEGRDKAHSEMATSVQLANETTQRSLENAHQYQASQERVILELAMQTASRIIGATLDVDKEKFLSVVRRALKEVREMKEIKLYVSNDYFKLVSDNRGELASIFPPNVPFLIFANEDFDSTECYIETNHGRIVVGIDNQLNHLREQLIEIMESGD